MKAIVKEAAKYVGISTGIALGIFCFVGMLFDLYYGGNFSLSGYQFTKMVLGCVVVGWGFGVPAVVYRKENMPMPIRVVIHMGSGCVIYTLVACWVGWIDLSAGLWQGNRHDCCPAGSSISDLVFLSAALPSGSERDE